jgi:hypothetical protein
MSKVIYFLLARQLTDEFYIRFNVELAHFLQTEVPEFIVFFVHVSVAFAVLVAAIVGQPNIVAAISKVKAETVFSVTHESVRAVKKSMLIHDNWLRVSWLVDIGRGGSLATADSEGSQNVSVFGLNDVLFNRVTVGGTNLMGSFPDIFGLVHGNELLRSFLLKLEIDITDIGVVWAEAI